MTLIHRTCISPTLLSLRIALKSYLFTRCYRVPLIRLATTRVAVNDNCARYKCVYACIACRSFYVRHLRRFERSFTFNAVGGIRYRTYDYDECHLIEFPPTN